MNRSYSNHNKNKSGQALIEVCVCMIAIMTVLLALIQINEMARAETDTLVAARREAGQSAMQETAVMASPGFLYDWEDPDGGDGMRYSADDEQIDGSSSRFSQHVIENTVSDAGEWNIFENHDNYMKTMHDDGGMNPSAYFGMIKGEDSETITLLDGFRKLIYNADTVEIESEVWMTWTKGIY